MKNRSLAAWIAVVLMAQMFSVGTVSVSAESTDSRAVKFLLALGIMENDANTGKFWDDTPVKRSEMAMILCRIFGFSESPEDTPQFIDVRDEDRAYVETAVRNGYMSGYGDGEFGAEDYVTNEQVIKIFVTVLGGGPLAESMGGYPSGYLNAGKRLGITSGVNAAPGDAARRIDVAAAIYDAMNADVLKLNSMGGGESVYSTVNGKTFLTETLDIYRGSGIVKKNDATALNRPSGAGSGLAQVGDTVYRDSEHLLDDYLGCDVVVYAKMPDGSVNGEILYVEESKDNKAVVIEDKNINGISGRTIKYYDGNKERSLTVAPVADMIYNGKAAECDLTRMMVKNGYVKLIDNNGDNTYDVILIMEYSAFVVDGVQPADERIMLKYGEAPIELHDCMVRIFRNGSKATLEEISEGDVLLAAISQGTAAEPDRAIRIEARSDFLAGSVESVRTEEGKEYVKINGVEYRVSDYCKALAARGQMKGLQAGDAGQFYFDVRDEITVFALNAASDSVGYLIASHVDASFSPVLSVRIYTVADKIEMFTASGKIRVNNESIKTMDIQNNSWLKQKLNEPQLVKYSVSDRSLKEIIFAADSYDAVEFSKDIEGTLRCTGTSTLDDKYYVAADTRVFVVPEPATDDKAQYGIYTGAYFIRDTNYSGVFYDIGLDGKIGFAVIKRGAEESCLVEGSPLAVVTEIANAINDEGDLAAVLQGFDESGKEIQIEINEPETAAGIEAGDVIQYRLDFNSRICEIKRLQSAEGGNYHLSTLFSTTKYVYGEVGYRSSERVSVSGQPIKPDMSPLEMIKLVNNTGEAVYMYRKDTGKLIQIDFSEIANGDKIFACVSGGNKTRMLVIYK